jgi:hypothetical protein
LVELLESETARSVLDRGEERGWIDASEFEAFAVECELAQADVEELTGELERIGIEVRQPASDDNTPSRNEEAVYDVGQPAGLADSLQLFLARIHRAGG